MADKIDYLKLSNELDQIVSKMQDDNTSIEESMKLYERGVEVIKELNAYLETAENKIKQISRLDKEN